MFPDLKRVGVFRSVVMASKAGPHLSICMFSIMSIRYICYAHIARTIPLTSAPIEDTQ